MNYAALRRRRFLNRMQTLLLVLAMAALVGSIGYIIGGYGVAAIALVGVLYLLNPALSPRLLMSMFRGYRLDYRQAAPLYAALAELCRRAGLPAVPVLYYLPTPMMNAFAVGRRDNAAIALSDGLLRAMNPRQLAAVLAHEVSHIAHNDLRTMAFADLAHRFTLFLSLFGQVLLLLNLPLLLWTDYHISWLAILLLVLSPTLSALLQLGLSRSREYEADRLGAELVGDPQALASALALMERYQGGFIEQLLFPNRNRREPSLLRTHPPTEKRIQRLRELQGQAGRRGWRPLQLHEPYSPGWPEPLARRGGFWDWLNGRY